MFIKTKFGLLHLKKHNTLFTLKYGCYAQKDSEEVFQADYCFGKLGGYKGLYCSKYYENRI